MSDGFTEAIQKSPFRRMDCQIEIEVKNARKNWKKGKISDDDFQRILKTMRHREDVVLAEYVKAEKEWQVKMDFLVEGVKRTAKQHLKQKKQLQALDFHLCKQFCRAHCNHCILDDVVELNK